MTFLVLRFHSAPIKPKIAVGKEFSFAITKKHTVVIHSYTCKLDPTHEKRREELGLILDQCFQNDRTIPHRESLNKKVQNAEVSERSMLAAI